MEMWEKLRTVRRPNFCPVSSRRRTSLSQSLVVNLELFIALLFVARSRLGTLLQASRATSAVTRLHFCLNRYRHHAFLRLSRFLLISYPAICAFTFNCIDFI